MSISEFLNFSIPTEPNQRLCLYNLKQDSLALALHQIAGSYEGTILVVTPDNQMANRLEAALKFFSPQLTVLNLRILS